MWSSDRTALLEELQVASRSMRREPKKGAVDCLCLVHELPPPITREALQVAADEWPVPGGCLLLLTDLADFGLFRALARRVELLPPRSTWNALGQGPRYDSFVAQRAAEVISMYRPLRTIGVGGPSRAALRATRALMRAQPTPGTAPALDYAAGAWDDGPTPRKVER